MLRTFTSAAATLCCTVTLCSTLPAQFTRDLFADVSARNVGDILTIVVSETHKIKNEDKVDRRSASTLASRLEAYTLGSDAFKSNTLPKIDIRTEKEHKGEAKQEKDSKFDAQIAVIVVDVQPNGNLVIAGKRVITIDDETKTLRISGLVRTLDVSSKNTVTSSMVADARISFTSEGGNARHTTKGPVATMFDTLIWAVWPF